MKRYHEVMEKIEVDDAMRDRILNNIEKTDLTSEDSSKIRQFPAWRRSMRPLATVACLAVVVLAAWGGRNLLLAGTQNTMADEVAIDDGNEANANAVDAYAEDADLEGAVAVVPQIVECNSAEELSGVVGFAVKDLTGLPFTVTQTTYIAYWDIAEITYIGNGEYLTYRKSAGEEDNSGDYNEYEDTLSIDYDTTCLTLKGADNSYNLCTWQSDGYAYSLGYSKEPAGEGPATDEIVTDRASAENQMQGSAQTGLSAAFYETMFLQIIGE